MTYPDRPTNPPRTLARSLGMFVGHILRAAKSDPADHDPETVARRTTTREETGHAATGERVTLRRTVIEEIEIASDEPDTKDDPA
ncbi:MAG: hypothetical protein AAGH64_10465 [Planctomycetota bacterium]